MRFSLLVTLFALAGCPDPVDPNLPGGGAPGGEIAPMGPNGGPPQEGAPQPADGAAPPTDGAPQPAGAGASPAPAPPTPPGLASLVKNGATVTVSGTLEGAKKAQIDFQFYTKAGKEESVSAPENIEIVQVTDGTFSVKAPATSDRDLYITATAKQGDQPASTDPVGFVGPLKLAGKDLAVTIKLLPNGVAKHPWFREGGPPLGGALPPTDGAAPPPNGTAPPAGGAAPTPDGKAAPTPTPAVPPTPAAPAAKAPAAAPKVDAKAGKAPAAPK